MGSLAGLSEGVNPPSFMVPLEPPRLTSGKADLIFPMWVSRAAGWRGWLGGFLQGVPHFLHHIIQALAHQVMVQRCIRELHTNLAWRSGTCTTHVSSLASTLHGSGLGKPSKIWFQIPLFCSRCPVVHEKCSKKNGKMNCRHFPLMFYSCVFSCSIQNSGIILYLVTSFICCCYSLVFLLTLQWATHRTAR